MSYLISLKTALLLFPFIALIFTIPFILYEYHKYGAIHYFRAIIIYTFILYLISIYFLVILPLPTLEECLQIPGPHYNFIPFSFASDFLKNNPLVLTDPSTYLSALKHPSFYVVIFNIFMTIPFGMYLRYYFKCSLKRTVFYTFLLSLFFEFTQGSALYFIYPNPYRFCDIDDLILNTTGGFIGYYLMGIFKNILPTRLEIDRKSYQKGTVVSGLRRLSVFFLDLSLYILTSLIFLIFTKHPLIYAFIFLYIIIPLLSHGSSIGMLFLNVKILFPKYSTLKNIIRSILLYLYYFYIPLYIPGLIFNLTKTPHLIKTRTIFFLFLLLFLFFFYIYHFLKILFTKRIYYDKFFTYKFTSTININASNSLV